MEICYHTHALMGWLAATRALEWPLKVATAAETPRFAGGPPTPVAMPMLTKIPVT
jgi:hypothetical protein